MKTSSPAVSLLVPLYGCILHAASLALFAQAPSESHPPPNTAVETEDPEFHRAWNRVSDIDLELKSLLDQAGITPLQPGKPSRRELVRLGQFLFHDKILSGNRDVSCATCHHDLFLTGDACSLSVGTGSQGLGPLRPLGKGRKFTPRNTPEIFNRGLSEWRVMFWDGRVERIPGGFRTPAKDKLPAGFTHVLQAQAMFPVTSRTEMRGDKGDRDVFGNLNELAEIDDEDFPAMWKALMRRLLGPDGSRNPRVPSYRRLFAEAYPNTPASSLGFQHAAAAIAAFERAAYTLLDSPWDRYLAGELGMLPLAAKRGAIVFYGKAKCASCHSGNLMTDQKHHNILIPHIGSLSLNERAEDMGRHKETQEHGDSYTFRTPPLRNVAETGPWMHNGLYTTLEAAVRHHLDPVSAFQNYDARQLTMQELRPHVHNTEEDLQALISTLATELKSPPKLSETELRDLIHFLHALTSPSLKDLDQNVPQSVPSGLPVD